jgi:hypothetical protein
MAKGGIIMKKYKKRILEVLGTLAEPECQARGKDMEPRSRAPRDYIPFLLSGLSSTTLAMARYGTKEMFRVKEAALTLKGPGPAHTNEEIVERLLAVQAALQRDGKTSNFRRKRDWTVPRSAWGDIFVSDGLTAVDKLVLSTQVVITAPGHQDQAGVFYYLPWNAHSIAGAGRIICEELFRETSDPVFDIRVRDR